MSRPLHVGILGAGDNTRQRHIPGLLEQPDVAIVSVCNRTLESSRRVCESFDIPKACDKPEQVIEDPEIDAVVIGTWPYRHCPFTVAALEAGKHVMCEARMAMNAEEGRRMLDASRQRPQLVAQIVPAPFSLAHDERIRRVVSQRLGPIRGVRLRLHQDACVKPRPQRTWRLNRTYSGNNIMGVGIWYETVMRWVGPVADVRAELRTYRDLGVDPDTGREVPIDVPDHVEAIGTMAAGGTFSLSASAVWPGPPTSQVEIAGEHGLLTYTPGHAEFHDIDGGVETIDPDPAQGWRVEEEFVRAIRGEETIRLTDFETGLRYMRFTDALHESNRLGQCVRV